MNAAANMTKVLACLGLRTKLAIVGGMLAAALVVTCALLFVFLSSSISDTRHAREGLEYLRGLRAVAHAVQAHRSATVLVLTGVDAYKAQRGEAFKAAQAAADAMQFVDARLGATLAPPNAWATIRKRWGLCPRCQQAAI